MLRLAVVLRTRFHVELKAHRELLVAVRELLDGAPFPVLWGATVAIHDLHRCEPPPAREVVAAHEDAILLRLDRHLEVLSQGFGLPDPVSQLPLLPVLAVHGATSTTVNTRLAKGGRP